MTPKRRQDDEHPRPRRLVHQAILLCSLALSDGCISPADSRVDRDENVGKASSEANTVDVKGGLAVIRHFQPGELMLWGSAPSFELELATATNAPETWRIELANAMPGATLRVDGQLIIGSVSDLPTRAIWDVALEQAKEHVLSVSAPNADAERAFFFSQLNDVQNAIDGMVDLVKRVNEEPEIDFVLGIGDLTADGSVPELERYEAELSALKVPYFSTLGNHELGVRPPPYHDFFGRGSYSFLHKGVRFTLVDSASATLSPTVYDWIQDWLSDGQDQVHIVGMHIPPLDPSGTRHGAFASKPEAAKLLGMLRRGQVDLTLYGHIHTYIEFTNAGIPARIVGGGGAIPNRGDRIGRHYMMVEVAPNDGIRSTRPVRIDGDFDDL